MSKEGSMQFLVFKDKDGIPTKSMLIRDDGFIEEYTTNEKGNTVKKLIEPIKEITEDHFA